MKYTIRHDKNEKPGRLLGDGKLALGVTLGAIAVLLLMVGLQFFAGPVERSDFITAAPIVVSLLVAATSTYLAANALLEQRKVREAGTDPVLIAHLGQREDARELVTFNVTNIGAGAALNVELRVDEPEGGVVGRNFLTNIFKPHHPFAIVQQGKSVEFALTVGWELLGDTPLLNRLCH